MMLPRKIMMVGLVLVVAACSRDRDITLTRFKNTGNGPDEFAIAPGKPLEAPESYSALPTPQPGAGNRTDHNTKADGIAALGGNPAATADTGVAPGDAGLVRHAVVPDHGQLESHLVHDHPRLDRLRGDRDGAAGRRRGEVRADFRFRRGAPVPERVSVVARLGEPRDELQGEYLSARRAALDDALSAAEARATEGETSGETSGENPTYFVATLDRAFLTEFHAAASEFAELFPRDRAPLVTFSRAIFARYFALLTRALGSGAKVSFLHRVHFRCPVRLLAVPGMHGRHDAELLSGWWKPFGHAAHVSAFWSSEKLPAAHVAHCD